MYEISCRVAEQFPGKAILETTDWDFQIEKFAHYGMAEIAANEQVHNHVTRDWVVDKQQIDGTFQNGALRVRWSGLVFDVIRVQTQSSSYSLILADRREDVERFFAAVCKFNHAVGGEVFTFRSGMWSLDWKLTEQITRANLDDLIMPSQFKADLVDQFVGFFEAKDLYQEHGVPWKRGVLLLGPPGNGKTMFIRAIANRLQVPILYVRGFESNRYTATDMMSAVFYRARQSQPCLLVFEDLDSMLKKENLSFFLNEMDGLSSNHGILTVATTNHPERLDAAITDRPSRFDRKVVFGPPAFPERVQLLERMMASWKGEMRLTDDQRTDIAKRIEGFSGAYVKEVCVSSMIGWMSRASGTSMFDLMSSQIDALRAQMASPVQPKEPDDEDDEDSDD